MLLFVYGEDTFRAQEKVQFLREQFSKKHDPSGMNLSVFPGSDGAMDAGTVLQAAACMGFMAPRRMIVVRELLSTTKKEQEEVWLTGFTRVPAENIIVFWDTMSSAMLEKRSLFKQLRALPETHAYPFPLLEGINLEKWTLARITERGGTAASSVIRDICERVGGDLWQLDGEIQKLVAYANGKPITSVMVNELVRASFDGEIFALMDAVSGRRPSQILPLLSRERASGTDDFHIFAMLVRQVRILLGARALLDSGVTSPAALASEMALNPYVASKAMQQAKAFSMADLRKAHNLLFRLDMDMKSGGADAEEAVDLATVELLKV